MSTHPDSRITERAWNPDRAWAWYRERPWIVGCNFIPSTASNQLEMWQADTFDPETIDRELGFARQLGFNTVRVFLHDLLSTPRPTEFASRVDRFLDIAASHNIHPIVVLFDGVWTNRSYPGPQPEPTPGIHNSTWLQSPHPKVVVEPERWDQPRAYLTSILSRFADDERILMWDLYNEPGNEGLVANAFPFLTAVFRWAREVNPSQPITAGLWNQDPQFAELNRFQVDASDIVTFHSYDPADTVRSLIETLSGEGKPMLCTEYMARPLGSRFETHLPLFREAKVGCVNWGLVSGRSQTIYPWESQRDAREPEVWFHDILRSDGSAFDPSEITVIQRLTDVSHRGTRANGR